MTGVFAALTMTLRNPKLDLLKTFERAAFHGNLTRAAEELCITQAAVSRQIGLLEEQLGVKLFKRSNRGISLTEHAQPLYETLHTALADIATAVTQIHQLSTNAELRLTLAIDNAFADTWFKRRFLQLREQYPNIQFELQLISNSQPVPNADLQIIYWPENKPLHCEGYKAEFIYQAMDFVVCSPKVITDSAPLKDLSDLKHHSLLHEFTAELWPNWLQQFGVEDVDASQGAIVHDASLCLEMAANGEAVILSDDLVAADYLADGRLIKPLPYVRPNEGKIFLLQKNQQVDSAAVLAFKDWLLDQLQQHEARFAMLRQSETYPKKLL